MKTNGGRVSSRALAAIILLTAIPAVTVCIKKEPIRVGFVAELGGKQAEFGVQERYGAELAIEDINARGGVAGRPLELLVRDDLGTAEGARLADTELIRARVVAIIGHATSQQTFRGREVTEPAKVVLISATVSTPELSGIDDYFFRVMTTLEERGRALTQRLFERGVTRLALIYDTDNAAFSESHVEVVTRKLESLGGKVVSRIGFSSKGSPDFRQLVMKMRESGANGVFIIAPDADTALIAQQARLLGWKTTLGSAGWAMTDTLLQSGGKAVEGMLFTQSFDMGSSSPTMQDFRARFQSRFGRPPLFAAALAYEAAKVLAAALQKTSGNAKGLKEALLQTRDFPGLASTLSMDPFGDIVRPSYLVEVRNLQFVITEALPPEPSSPSTRN